eukprot:115725-Amphidinium_carterae.2
MFSCKLRAYSLAHLQCFCAGLTDDQSKSPSQLKAQQVNFQCNLLSQLVWLIADFGVVEKMLPSLCRSIRLMVENPFVHSLAMSDITT